MLTSLKGAPRLIGGNFDCSGVKFTSLGQNCKRCGKSALYHRTLWCGRCAQPTPDLANQSASSSQSNDSTIDVFSSTSSFSSDSGSIDSGSFSGGGGDSGGAGASGDF